MESIRHASYKRKKIFPHRYSKRFYNFALSKGALWTALLQRLRNEKDAMVLVTGDTGCLTGDTIIRTNRNTLGRKYTIKYMYEQYHGIPTDRRGGHAVHRWDLTTPTYVRSFNGEKICLHLIKDVVYSGKKEVYKLLLKDGKTIKATSDHKIMTNNGFIELDKLDIKNDLIMCDSPRPCKGNIKPKIIDAEVWGIKYHPRALKKIRPRIAIHQAIYEANLNNLTLEEFIRIVSIDEEKAKKLKYMPDGYVIHHKDENHFNNEVSNLDCVSLSKHKELHAAKNTLNFNQGIPIYVQIESIEKVGIEDTYDIICDEPYHNFSANDIIVHNSGKSHFVGNMCFKLGENEDNFIMNDGSKMFIPEENFIVDPDEFAFKMINKTGAVLWGDEFRRSANRRDWYSKINKTIVDRKNTNRKLFNIYFLCLPYEREFDDALAAHLHVWIWIRRGVGEVYCKISGVKGGSGLNIKKILEREEKYLAENPTRSIVPPTIHPEYIGRVYFAKLSKKLKKKYDDLVQKKKAVGDLTEEEKIKYGIEVVKTPEDIIREAIHKVKNKEIQSKIDLWAAMDTLEGDEAAKLKKLNFYLKLEFGKTFEKMFAKSKEEDIIW